MAIFTKLLRSLAIGSLVLWLAACGAMPATSQTRDYLPGGAQFYSYGVSQSKENFENIERAQSDYTLFKGSRHWIDITPRKSPAEFNVLQAYYPLHARWKLKDGREFIAEAIDIRAIMREYFKTNQIKLPWQLEGRSKAPHGDYPPSLVHELKDDTVIIKWLITTNLTPVEERFAPSGAAVKWKLSDQEFIVNTVKGTPTSGIDFENRRDSKK
jgi:hypothetical protein